MSEKYIRQNKNSCNIVKNSRIYAKTKNLDDAIFIRDLLISNDWNLNSMPQIIQNNDNYLVLAVIDEKLHLLAKYKCEPSDETIEKLIKKHSRNPNNSRYGLNITRFYDTFIIQKTIFGDEYIFGYYNRLDDAEFVRNFLLDHNWNINEFKQIEFDDETNTYKVMEIIDDNVYVLDSFKSKENIDLDKVHEEFLTKISKHKERLSVYPHLDLLKDKIYELEIRFNVKLESSPLNNIIFNLTPFQKVVYDAVSQDSSLDEIKKSLIRYRSGNFEKKIIKNLDDLVDMDLIEKNDDDTYSNKKYTNL